jgi:hypothetical protein
MRNTGDALVLLNCTTSHVSILETEIHDNSDDFGNDSDMYHHHHHHRRHGLIK